MLIKKLEELAESNSGVEPETGLMKTENVGHHAIIYCSSTLIQIKGTSVKSRNAFHSIALLFADISWADKKNVYMYIYMYKIYGSILTPKVCV